MGYNTYYIITLTERVNKLINLSSGNRQLPTPQIFLRRCLIALFDLLFLNLSFVAVCGLKYNLSGIFNLLIGRAWYASLIYLAVLTFFGLYNSMWEYAGLHELLRCLGAVVTSTLLTYGVDSICRNLSLFNQRSEVLPDTGISISVYFFAALLTFFLSGFLRIFYRSLRSMRSMISNRHNTKRHRIMIIGAGDTGITIYRELELKGFSTGKPVVFVDDDPNKQGRRVGFVPVRGSSDRIPELAKRYDVDEIILAVPSMSSQRRGELLKIAMDTGCKLKTSLSFEEITENPASEGAVRNVEIADLLARPEIKLNPAVCSYLKGQTVMVTGGGGSIGSELCTQVARYSPKRIIIFDNYENNAFLLKGKLDRHYKGKVEFIIRIGSIQDPKRLREVMNEFKPTVLFHAAAHKHVPLMEESPCEAVKNNVFGTYNVANAAVDCGVKKVVTLSTDKAVNPTNVMGASKRETELIIQYFERKNTSTHFAAVRFGNVLGSNGSVIPIFKEQIESGGPVIVTHKDITRYFMTIPEAAQLVCQAGGLSRGGEIFVLDMGEPVSITSLAEKLIRLSGYTPYVDIKIEFSGLRPGEKLYEELTLSEEEGDMQLTANNKIFVLPPIDFDTKKLEQGIKALRHVNDDNVRELLRDLVPNFHESEASSQ